MIKRDEFTVPRTPLDLERYVRVTYDRIASDRNLRQLRNPLNQWLKPFRGLY